MPPSAEQLIRQYAARYNIDPRAAIAVAMGEGGLRNRAGDIGDLGGGGSYGPFQLYAQGALPARFKGNPRAADAWAWSPQGINYAIRQMAAHGAKGLRGDAAINAIIRRFERPLDPDASVRNALGRYASVKGGGAGRMRQQGPQPRRKRQNRGAMKRAGIAALNQIAQGGADPTQIFSSLAAARREARKTGGTLTPPKARGGRTPESNQPVINKILKTAHAQIGKPYVWGGESPGEGGFDCSGLIDWAYRQAGIDLPGRLTTWSAMGMGRSVKGKKLMPGDFVISNDGKHMTMYVGGGKVIAAPSRGSVVRYQPLKTIGSIVDIRRVL